MAAPRTVPHLSGATPQLSDIGSKHEASRAKLGSMDQRIRGNTAYRVVRTSTARSYSLPPAKRLTVIAKSSQAPNGQTNGMPPSSQLKQQPNEDRAAQGSAKAQLRGAMLMAARVDRDISSSVAFPPEAEACAEVDAEAGADESSSVVAPVVEVVEEVAVQEEAPFRVVTLQAPGNPKVDYLGESTKGDMKLKRGPIMQGRAHPEESASGAAALLDRQWASEAERFILTPERGTRETVDAEEAEQMLEELGIPSMFPHGLPSRGIFCSRTLNLRSITTIGYDMDYTLIHYNVNAWEGRAYEYAKENLKRWGYPVEGLKFDPNLVIRGLIMDKEKGNIVKADRFGYIKRATHGTSMLPQNAMSALYGRELVDLRKEERWEFMNTLFSVSEAVIYLQLVDRLDAGLLPSEIAPNDYAALYQVVSKALFRAHVEGQLKAEIINEPDRFVELDPALPLALLDQKEAGKRLLLITNSDYTYTNKMMAHSFDRFLPNGMTWRNLFDMVIVSAMKPDFFSMNHPLYEIVTPDGLMRQCFKAKPGGLYCGGSAQMVEKALGFSGDETMYVGDHIYTDVSQSKQHLRWRTCLILRELEMEVEAQAKGESARKRLLALMEQKDRVGHCFNQLRLAFQRRGADREVQTPATAALEEQELLGAMKRILRTMEKLDQEIAPLLESDGAPFNSRWGHLLRAGLWDKSHLTRQIEKYADIYTSRVSNFLWYTPFMYFRAQRQLTAHDVSSSWGPSGLEQQKAP